MNEETNQLVQSRIEKLEELRRAGVRPYANDFRVDTLAREVHDRWDAASAEELGKERGSTHLRIAGRILTLRNFGKATFFHLQDRSGKIQVYARKDALGEEGFKLLRMLDPGDIVGVVGGPFRTRTGELTIDAAGIRLLSKSIRPLPEKWHGLKDVETRYRQRYLDLIANPEVREVFVRRAKVIRALRAFFDENDFLEVETPMMQSIPGGAAARPFKTHHNALGIDLYLRVAPELYLKKLVVGGLERVYELSRCFRNEGLSRRHNPEYTMVEFYQAHATYTDLMELTERLFLRIAEELGMGRKIPYQGHEIDLTPPWPRLPLHEAVGRHLEAETPGAGAKLGDLAFLRGVAARHEVALEADAAAGEIILALFEKLVEPGLIQPTFVVDYPVEVSPLARRSDERPGIVERFEVFIAGIEVANAFSELADPVDQRQRFERQVAAARDPLLVPLDTLRGFGVGQAEEDAGGAAAPDVVERQIDEDFLRAVEHGLPPTAGEGIGIDRLVMLFTDMPSIRDVILFPQLRPEV